MHQHNIKLAELVAHGSANVGMENNIAVVTTSHSITPGGAESFIKRHYVSLPENYSLPLRVDMTVMLDYPEFYLFIGEGHIAFASGSQDNRKIADIIKTTPAPNLDKRAFNNSLPLGKYIDISVILNFDEMQISIDGEERFYSRDQPYMKAKNLDDKNAIGFSMGLAVAKRSVLHVRSIAVSCYDAQIPITHFEHDGAVNNAMPMPSSYEEVISRLPNMFREKIIYMDGFLKAQSALAFKRRVGKANGKITYVSPEYGISYTLHVTGREFTHYLNWYIVFNGTPETWHRKADYMEETLNYIAKTQPDLAERIFNALIDCLDCYGPRCLAKTLYSFNGETRLTCHGRALFRMSPGDIDDVMEFIRHLNALLENKAAAGEKPPEKIMLAQKRNADFGKTDRI